jgi:predicted ATPase
MSASIKDLIEAIQRDFDKSNFDRFIHDATFPNFKKIKPFTKIDFRFPLTVLVGANGGGKSSILHALWGMPSDSSTSRYWFPTKIDPITTEGERNVPRYWYTHYIKALNLKVQTRKVYPKKFGRSWEPSRPSVTDGMQEMPKVTDQSKPYMSPSGQRWTAAERKPVYVNTKSESSAFDRFFQHTAAESIPKRQASFVFKSKRLHRVIEEGVTSTGIGSSVSEIEHIAISPAQLAAINSILGKRYVSAKKIVHGLFERNKSSSVIFVTEDHTYSESFAGSGELAIVNLVLRVEELGDFDLLLIDEPETSLHPGAQVALLRYLLQKIKEKRLQVVLATHSPTIVQQLPEKALVVLEETKNGTTVNAHATKSSAFYRLGQPDPNKVTLLTEDHLLRAYVERAVKQLSPDLERRIVVVGAVTGVSEMLSHQIPAYINTPNSRVIMILDGDQTEFVKLISIDPNEISEVKATQITVDLHEKCNVTIVGSKPDVSAYVAWCQKNILLLDYVCPEQVFLALLKPSNQNSAQLSNKDYKKAVKEALSARGDATDAQSQYTIFKNKLGESVAGGLNASSETAKKLHDFAEKIRKAIDSAN